VASITTTATSATSAAPAVRELWKLNSSSTTTFRTQQQANASRPYSDEPSSVRNIFSSYRVFKKSGALAINFSPPRIAKLKSNSYKRTQPGMCLFQFANATAIPGKRTVEYDWKNKTIFNCSASELGEVLAFHRFTNATDIRFIHDPNISDSQLRGNVLKEFVMKRNGLGKGYFFTVTVTTKESGKESKTVHTVSVTDGEFEVIVELLRQSIPKILCMDSILPLEETATEEIFED
jgi:hypothetical protein